MPNKTAKNNTLHYSFNPNFYNDIKDSQFDTEQLKRIFNLYPLESYTIYTESDANDVSSSNEIISTQSYPLFVFIYESEYGRLVRKYEPYLVEEKIKYISPLQL